MNNVNMSKDLQEKSSKSALFHTLTVEDSLVNVDTSVKGLSDEEAIKRISVYGKNELDEGKKRTIFAMLFDQFKNIMIVVLLVATVISALLGEVTDAIIILVVVIINAVLGVAQESKADKALAELKKMSSPYAKIKRNGQANTIKTEEIVPGDIVYLEAGDYVPADIRLIESASLKVEESSLTGESVPVEKSVDKIEHDDIVIGDRKNMVYLGSSVTYGRGLGVAVGTGMNTEVGKIAGYISNADIEETPLQKKLAEMSKYLSVGIIIIAVIIFITGVIENRGYFEMFLIAVSLAVAAIPEGLPAIVTIVLAMGMQRMAKKNAIIRKLPAVETLGGTEIICSDKTGTLTQNKMTVKEIFFSNKLVPCDNVKNEDPNLDIYMQAMILCNDSKVTKIEETNIKAIGDPTETALIYFGFQKKFDKISMENAMPRVSEIPFDSDRKLMTTMNKINNGVRVLTKGAPDVLLQRCTNILVDGQVQAMNELDLQTIKNANTKMAGKALRVLAMAYKELDNVPKNVTPENIENDFIFVGLVGMIDPPREEAKEAVRICKCAGIRPIMITGDHKGTAAAIAKELNITSDDSQIITGSDLDKISDEDFLKNVSNYSVYARVSPEHKVRIVKAWKDNGKVVAMTGDGVNDAPALKTSDIGVGMGITGTDVSKGVSDMVLSDDNFATIVVAVEEGRKIYSNIRKSIHFLLSANMGEVIALFIATLLNWRMLFPIHILWINLVTDTFPALALGVEKAEKGIMNEKPRKSEKSFFAGGLGINIIYQGVLEGVLTLVAYYIGATYYSHEIATTMAFATLGLIQLFHAFNARSSKKSIFSIKVFSNKYLNGAVAMSAVMMLSVILIPGLNSIFKVEFLNFHQWLIVVGCAFLIIPIVEVVKFFQRRIG
ncbi:MAG: calcium-translocating P-type ATPase, SERCA-type [Clostridia bacterium]|nr:calcium-translocating P-type ATPase, SERCA-type [Clostridia bacterium]MDD4048708.1 calcium-translocating P-type ATPase, SERCA-type [Clostridia bacterium]